MDLVKAKQVSNIVSRLTFIENALEKLNKGYKDEWVLENTHTGTTVELGSEHHQVFVDLLTKEKQDLEKELAKF
ncbi:MAG: hypothetical protein GX285_07970 [Clostridiales bacterium]|nr:hypothetical protein [Clostridiales bacterium]